MPTIFGTSTNNTLIVEVDDLRGLAGNDTYILANSLANDPANGNRTVVITDTEGNNRLQLVDGLQVSRVDFLGGNAVQFTLSNNSRIQVVGADRYTFDIGSNSVSNDTQGLLGRTFAQLAADLGVVLSNGSGSRTAPFTVQPGTSPVPPGGSTLPVVSIVASNTPLAEGNSGTTPYTFVVSRTGDSTTAFSVNYGVTGTGLNPASATDFLGNVLPSGVLNFAAGQTSQTLTLNVLGDTVVEADEAFSVTLTSANGATIGNGTVGRSIVNDDTATTDDFSANTATTGRVGVGGSTAGRIETVGDRDWFRVDLVAGTTYTAFLDGSGATGSLADPFLTVIAPNGAVLGSDDDAGPGLNSLVTFTATSTGAHFLEARAFGTAAGDVGSYTVGIAAAPPPPPPPPPAAPGFQIDLTYNGPTRFLAVIEAAIARWEQIITGDLPDVSTANGVIDDLSLTIDIVAIDGAGGILGQAGFDQTRAGTFGLPYTGSAELDVADVDQRLANGTLDDLVLHEIGHILGIGTLWSRFGFNTTFGRYTGSNGLVEYRTLSGNANARFVPLEQTGGTGTANSHWQESLFGSELLTGFLNNGSNPLSRLTIAALQDLGYQVSYASADPYALPVRLQEAAIGMEEPPLLMPFETTLVGVTRSADALA